MKPLMQGALGDIDRIAREHALLLEAIAVSPGPVAVYDDHDRLIAWNEAYRRIHAQAFEENAEAVARRALNYRDLIRRTVEAALPAAEVEAHIAERVAAHRRGDGAAAVRCYEGLGWFRVSKVRTPSGAVAGFAMAIDDLVAKTEALEAARAAEAEARKAAEAASEARARFLAAVSHELRTPLGGVMGLAALLDASTLDARQRKIVQTIRRSGEDLLAVLNDLLDDAQLANGAFALNPAPFSLAQAVADVAALFAARAEEKGLTLDVATATAGADAVIGDAGRLRQVLGNLVSNALKFTRAGGVRLAAQAAPGAQGLAVRIDVADDGPGMAEEQMAGLFSDYAQLEAGRQMGRGGTGLGLSLSQRIVTAMGGALTAQSRPGEGSTFTVALTLPAA